MIPLLLVLLALPQSGGAPSLQWRMEQPFQTASQLRPAESKHEGVPLMVSGELAFLQAEDAGALLRRGADRPLVAAQPIAAERLPATKLTLEAWVAVDMHQGRGGMISTTQRVENHERGWMLGFTRNEFSFGIAAKKEVKESNKKSKTPKGNKKEREKDEAEAKKKAEEEARRLRPDKVTYLTAPPAIAPGQWYHVVGTFDGEMQRLYVNGQLADQRVLEGDILYFDEHPLVIGAASPAENAQGMVGALHSVAVFDKALSPKVIRRRYITTLGTLPTATARTFTGIERAIKPATLTFQPRIEEAIDKGVEWLLQNQNRDGSWSFMLDTHRNGSTSLALYTLLKSGVHPDHPAAVAALEFLASGDPDKTYSVGCQLMALAAIGDMRHKEWVQRLVDLLLSYELERGRGIWGYPGGGDLSVTQYAALGFYGASKFGVEVPVDVWKDLVEATIDEHQMPARQVPWASSSNGLTGAQQVAGFGYRPNDGPGKATGSMTTAGLCVLGFAKLVVGNKLGRKHQRMIERAELPALNWLQHYYAISRNPGTELAGTGGGRTFYYLYGLERVAALYDIETLGENDWYRDGALWLVDTQKPDGTWNEAHEKTCFALLFLNRATQARRPTSGRLDAGAARQSVWNSSDGDVHLRVTGHDELTVWITGFDEAALESVEKVDAGLDSVGFRVKSVRYYSDGVEFATLDGKSEPWKGQRFAALHAFDEPGTHTIRCDVTLADGTLLTSDEVSAVTKIDAKRWMKANIQTRARNELRDHKLTLESSSLRDENMKVEPVIDGLDGTAWFAAGDDEAPWIRIQSGDPILADRLVLTRTEANLQTRGTQDRVARVEVMLNGNPETLTADAPEDPLAKIVLQFEKQLRIRSIEVRIVERTQVGDEPTPIGFAEIALELKK